MLPIRVPNMNEGEKEKFNPESINDVVNSIRLSIKNNRSNEDITSALLSKQVKMDVIFESFGIANDQINQEKINQTNDMNNIPTWIDNNISSDYMIPYNICRLIE